MDFYEIMLQQKLSGGGGGSAEVWFVGDEYEDEEGRRTFTLSNVDSTDHKEELFTNAENYQIVLNDEELPYMIPTDQDKAWLDNQSDPTKVVVVEAEVELFSQNQIYRAYVVYVDASTAPTSVEVSVKAK